MDDEYMERACAFNLGAAYIAMGQGEKGLNILQQAGQTLSHNVVSPLAGF
jgi:hypothetical protein